VRRHSDSVPVDLVSIETFVSIGPGQTARTAIGLAPGPIWRSARASAPGALRTESIGRNEHFIAGIRLNPGVNPAVVRRQLIAGADFRGPPPGELVQLIGVVSPKTTDVVQADLRPGVHLLACSYADRASAGHEHGEFGGDGAAGDRPVGRGRRHRSAASRRPRSVP
jgi:hypothetical protein